MRNIIDLVERIKPSAICTSIDQATIWMKRSLSERDLLEEVAPLCGSGGLHVHNVSAKFDLAYRQRLQLKQPTSEVLEFFAGRGDVKLNYAEFALDMIYDTEARKDAAYEFVCQHHVKKNHRNHRVRFSHQTRYTDTRWAPNNCVVYPDGKCKLTNQPNCLHVEWRITGAGALRRAGIDSVDGLLKLDHREFWRPRLLLRSLNRTHLGRQYHNTQSGSRRQRPWIISYGNFKYDMDARAGGTIIRALGSTQDVIDGCRKRFNINRSLVQIDNDQFLPAQVPAPMIRDNTSTTQHLTTLIQFKKITTGPFEYHLHPSVYPLITLIPDPVSFSRQHAMGA